MPQRPFSTTAGRTGRTDNERRLLTLVRDFGPLSRADLARRTGLAPLSVTRLIGDLIEEGLVVEGERVIAGRGQPSLPLSLAPEAAFAYGVSIAEDALSVVLIDLQGRVRAQRREPFDAFDKDAAIARLADSFDEMAGEALIDRDRLFGVGVAVSGFFTGQRRQINTPLVMEQWALADLDAEFSARFGLPVWIDNDGNAAAMGEALYGLGKALSSFAYLYVGRGLGGGVVLDGRLWRGRNGNAGEFTGVLPPERREDRPTLQLLRTLLEADGRRFDSIEAMLAGLPDGDPIIDRWAERARAQFEAILSAIAAIVDPEAIVLGGRLTPALADALIARSAFYTAPVRDLDRAFPPLLRSRVEGDATALGAAALAFGDHFF